MVFLGAIQFRWCIVKLKKKTNKREELVFVICFFNQFICFIYLQSAQILQIHNESITDNGWVLPADRTIFSKMDSYFKHLNISSSNNNNTEFPVGGFMLKRLPVRDGEHGYYRHVVFISMAEMRIVPLTMGRFEVTELLGWDELNEIIYFMATPKLKPGQRHLYRINLTLNVTTPSPNRIYITASQPVCLTCNNSMATFRLVSNSSSGNLTTDTSESYSGDVPNNCLYNKIYFSPDFTYYVQECLGTETPSIYLVETHTASKIIILHNGDMLRYRIGQLAIPQIRTFDVEIRHGFHAQVRLLLPPGMKEEEEVAFPLILHM